MEFASKYRTFVYVTRGFMIFTLSCLYSVLFLGVSPGLLSLGFIVCIIVALIFVLFMGVFSAFSPVFTNRQFYPVVLVSSVIGVVGVILGLLI